MNELRNALKDNPMVLEVFWPLNCLFNGLEKVVALDKCIKSFAVIVTCVIQLLERHNAARFKHPF